MAENKGKRHTIAIIIPLLLILAAAFFVFKNNRQKQAGYILQRNESGYIDVQAVYNSNRNYNIVKKEIAEYANRINKELAMQLAQEPDEARRIKLKQQTQKEIELYAQTLLQDIDKDVDNAIDEVAESKNLKRVYITGSVRQNAKNMTQAVITELNMTIMQRLGGYLEQQEEKKEKVQPKFEEQFNFNSYPVAKVPEQGVTKEASGNVATGNKNSLIVAGTQQKPETEDNAIIKGCKHMGSAIVSFTQARNIALTGMQMSPRKAAVKTVIAKSVGKQPKTEIKTATNRADIIAASPGQITSAQIGVLFNTVAAGTYAVVGMFKEQSSVAICNSRNTIASAYAECRRMWQNICLSVQPQDIQTDHTGKPTAEAKTDAAVQGQQTVVKETSNKTNLDKDGDKTQPTADETTDIKQSKKQNTCSAEQKAQEKKSVKTAENGVAKPVTIQVAACLNKSGAEAAVKKLCGKHIPARVYGIEKGGRQWWCVRVTAANSVQAEDYKRKLSNMGYSGIFVR